MSVGNMHAHLILQDKKMPDWMMINIMFLYKHTLMISVKPIIFVLYSISIVVAIVLLLSVIWSSSVMTSHSVDAWDVYSEWSSMLLCKI